MATLDDAIDDLDKLPDTAIDMLRDDAEHAASSLARGLRGAVHRKTRRLSSSFKATSTTQLDGSFKVAVTSDIIYSYPHLSKLGKPHLPLERDLVRRINESNRSALG